MTPARRGCVWAEARSDEALTARAAALRQHVRTAEAEVLQKIRRRGEDHEKYRALCGDGIVPF